MKHLNNTQLIQHTKNLVNKEKEITEEILKNLAEIQCRKLYLDLGYASLFDFCTKELGYSEGSANRRISAMRLSRDIPEVTEKLKTGEVNLSTLTQLHTFIRAEEKRYDVKMNNEEKLELLDKISNKSQKQCERELAKLSPETVLAQERIRPVNYTLTELKIVADEKFMKKLYRLKEVLSHTKPNANFKDIIEFALTEVLSKRDPTAAAAVNSNIPKVNAPNLDKRYIPKVWKAVLHQKANSQCEFIDLQTGRRCSSRHFLEVDHIQPLALNGKTEFKNLRLLCRSHNGHLAQKRGVGLPQFRCGITRHK